MGKSSINGFFSMAMLNNQMVTKRMFFSYSPYIFTAIKNGLPSTMSQTHISYGRLFGYGHISPVYITWDYYLSIYDHISVKILDTLQKMTNS